MSNQSTEVTNVSAAMKELLNRKLRLWLYVLSALALMAFAALEAAEGDWVKAIPVFLTSLVPVLAAANINPPPEIKLIPGEVGVPGEKGDPGKVDEKLIDERVVVAVEKYPAKHSARSDEDGSSR